MPADPATAPRSPGRRTLLKAMGGGAAGLAATPLWAPRASAGTPTGDAAPRSLLPAPAPEVPPLLDRGKVTRALARLDRIVAEAMASTGVPGAAVAVVYQDEVVYLKGVGLREVGRPEEVGPDTVFQLASVSKPLASTVVAALVGRGNLQWTDPVVQHRPEFALGDPYVTEHATFEDLMSHRSGLHTGAGDLLEDLGFDREYILGHLDQQPLDTFRASYNYSNFGYTAGGEAAAVAMQAPWEDLADQVLFQPLGMTSSSYRHSDYEARTDKALIHVKEDDGAWVARYIRNADAEAPAGGASSSVRDLAEWVRLQLGNGSHAGQEIVASDALLATRTPQVVSGGAGAPAGRAHFYGLGWNISYDDHGRLQIGHSGAFALGAATNVSLLPGEQLGIVALTNGTPDGVAEAIASGFLDVAQNGAPTVDWVSFLGGVFQAINASEAPEVDYTKVPEQPAPARPNNAYTGTYDNSYYGPLTVTEQDGALAMRLGPSDTPTAFALTHFDGDTFGFESIGERANGPAGAIFASDAGEVAPSVRLDFYDREGLGTFVRQTNQ